MFLQDAQLLFNDSNLIIFVLKMRLIIQNTIRTFKNSVRIIIDKHICISKNKVYTLCQLLRKEFEQWYLYFKLNMTTIDCLISPRITEHPMYELNNNNIQNDLLLGLMIGDCLGKRYNCEPDIARIQVAKDTNKNGHLMLLGKGSPLSSNTRLAILLYKNLRTFNIHTIAKEFSKWYNELQYDEGSSISVFSGIKNETSSVDAYNKIMDAAIRFNSKETSGDYLVRISPMVLLKSENVLDFTEQVVKLTHPNKVAIELARVYITALRYSLNTNDKSIVWEAAFNEAKEESIKDILIASQTNSPINNTDEMLSVFGVAFFELMNGKSFGDSLTRIVSRGGDAALNASVTGALLGSFYGKDGIPVDWVNSMASFLQ
jgi:ADP-ribosyl-[dinitrogen reductase] hydrolase